MRGWEVHCAGVGGTLCGDGRYIVLGWEVHCKGMGGTLCGGGKRMVQNNDTISFV